MRRLAIRAPAHRRGPLRGSKGPRIRVQRPRRGRTFTKRQNEIIVEKAIRYAPRGIVGIDIAGPRPHADGPYPYRTLRPLVQQARDAGLGVTIHVGEEGGAYGIAEIREVVSTLRPDRIGHGILAAHDKRLMGQISEAGIVLELCPTSNLLTKALESEEALRDTFRAFADCDVEFTIATDGPENDAHAPARRVRASAPDQCSRRVTGERCEPAGHEASFIPQKPLAQMA